VLASRRGACTACVLGVSGGGGWVLACLLDAFEQPFHVADGEEPAEHHVAGLVVRLTGHRRRVVRAHDPIEADLIIRAHRLEHVGLAVVVERLDELGGATAHVTEVDKVDGAASAEVANPRGHMDAHRREDALTERDAVDRAGHEGDGAFHRLRRDQNAGDTAQRRHRRVVGVERELDSSLFGDRHHGLEEVGERVPELLLRDRADLRWPGAFHQLVVVAGDERAAAGWRRDRGAGPVDHRHPVPAPHRNLELAHVADERDDPFDLLVPARQAEARPVHRRRGLNDADGEPGFVEALLHQQQGHKVPGAMVGRRDFGRDDWLGDAGLVSGDVPAADRERQGGDDVAHAELAG